MADQLTTTMKMFESFVSEKGWKILEQKDIDYGQQVIVTDKLSRVPVNIFRTGKIVPQGKSCELRTAITEWANLQRSNLERLDSPSFVEPRKNCIARYFVIPDNIETIHRVVLALMGDGTAKELTGVAETYRVEARQDNEKVTITQYNSGKLIVQGLSGAYYDSICETLDKHLTQSFSDHATRYIPEDVVAANSYLEKPEAENEATAWLMSQIPQKEVVNFLHDNDRRTLLAGAGVRNAIQKTMQDLPDYSVVVMPFAKAFEGYVVKLAQHLGLADQAALARKANAIEVGNWLETIKARLPDAKRYNEIADALLSAWGCRNKAVHSDFAYPYGVLNTFQEAEVEIITIIRAITRSYGVFVQAGIKLIQTDSVAGTKAKQHPVIEAPGYKYNGINQEKLRQQLESDGYPVKIQEDGRNNLWEVIQKPDLTVVVPCANKTTIILRGNNADEFRKRYKAFLA